MIKLNLDEKRIISMYLDDLMSLRTIALKVGCSVIPIIRVLKENNIKTRSFGDKIYHKILSHKQKNRFKNKKQWNYGIPNTEAQKELNSIKNSGINNAGYVDGKRCGESTSRRVARKHYNRICHICGETKGKIDVHHINKIRTDNHYLNLVVLCASCHQMQHNLNNNSSWGVVSR